MARRTDRLQVGMQDPTRPPHALSRIVARLADRLRFDSYWFLDHFMGVVPPGMWSTALTPAARLVRDPDEFFDPFVAVAAMGPRTKRLRLGIAVTDAVRQHPAWIARAALTLQHTTKGRFILGMGAGERENLEPYGLPTDRLAARSEEALSLIRQLWRGDGPVDHEGEFFRLRGASLSLRPYLRRPPPVWIAATGPRMSAVAGRYGDGWIAHRLSPDRYAAGLAAVRDAARAAGRDPDGITPALLLTCLADSSHEACHDALRAPAFRLASLIADAAAWEEAGAIHPLGPEFRGIVDFVPTRFTPDAIAEAMHKVPEELPHRLFPHGTPDEIAGVVRVYEERGLRHVILENVLAVGRPQKALSSFAALGRAARQLRR